MGRNVEVKARIDDQGAVLARVRSLADSGPVELSQDDTFFACPTGRLKLRVLGDGTAELIHYDRGDAAAPKPCAYVIAPVTAPAGLRDVLARAYGAIGRVRKQRTVFLVGNSRIHVDRVEGLGDFVELEVVLSHADTDEHGVAVADELFDRLGVAKGQRVAGSYLDLLQGTENSNR